MSSIPLPGKAIKGVYRGYMPIGLPQHRPPNRIKPWMKYKGKPVYTLYPKKDSEEYSDVAEYPPLNDATYNGLRSQVRHDWYEELKKVPTVDGKMYEMLRHARHFIGHTNNFINHYNGSPLAQYLTYTKLINELPQSYHPSFSTELINEVRDIVLGQIALDKYQSTKSGPRFVSKTYSTQRMETRLDNQLVQNIYSSLRKKLAIEVNTELLDYHHDLDPSIRSWWYHSGFEPPNKKIFYKSRKDEKGRINQMLQMEGEAALNLRSTAFLEPVVPFDDPLVTQSEAIPEFSHPLKEFGFTFKFGNPVALAGQWFLEDSSHDFPHTMFLTTKCLQLRERRSYKIVKPLADIEDALISQAVLTAFGWTNSMAMYHGFTPFNEIEYPFTCHVITTNGKDWLFNIYQLNSIAFHRDFKGPRKNNLCWSSGLMQLYKDFDGTNFHEVNDDVIRLLMKILSQQSNSGYTKSLKLRPYLSDDIRTEEDIEKERKVMRRAIEQRKNEYILHDWKVPLWERIFFHWTPARNTIKEMRPRYHIPKPKYPKIFE